MYADTEIMTESRNQYVTTRQLQALNESKAGEPRKLIYNQCIFKQTAVTARRLAWWDLSVQIKSFGIGPTVRWFLGFSQV